jgi:hypothetical protein
MLRRKTIDRDPAPRNAEKERLLAMQRETQDNLYQNQRLIITITCIQVGMLAVAVTTVMIVNDGDCLWPWSMVHVCP